MKMYFNIYQQNQIFMKSSTDLAYSVSSFLMVGQCATLLSSRKNMTRIRRWCYGDFPKAPIEEHHKHSFSSLMREEWWWWDSCSDSELDLVLMCTISKNVANPHHIK